MASICLPVRLAPKNAKVTFSVLSDGVAPLLPVSSVTVLFGIADDVMLVVTKKSPRRSWGRLCRIADT